MIDCLHLGMLMPAPGVQPRIVSYLSLGTGAHQDRKEGPPTGVWVIDPWKKKVT